MGYSSPSCSSGTCTQNFNAPSGYAGHNSEQSGNFQVQFGGGWGYQTAGVRQGDLLIATEGTYVGGVQFNYPTDSQANSWSSDYGYCSSTDCVQIFSAIASKSGSDTVTLYTTASGKYTYALLREFVGYTAAIDKLSSGSGTSGVPKVSSVPISSGDLVIAAAVESGGGWEAGQNYYMIAGNTGWYAAAQFSPNWTNGATTAAWSAPSGNPWVEVLVALAPPA